MKTDNLPLSRPAHPALPGHLRILSAFLLAAACLPALATQPEAARSNNPQEQTASVVVAAPTAAPAVIPPQAAVPALSTELVAAAASTPAESARTARVALPAPAQATATPANDRSLVRTVMQRAFSLLGTPYRWGGTSPESGFDCSGLVGYVFRTIGIDLPRVSRAMAGEGTPVTDRNALAEGDLVFFGRRGHVDHVGIYIGNGMFVHSPRTGRDVTVSNLSTGYWAQKFLSARRLTIGS